MMADLSRRKPDYSDLSLSIEERDPTALIPYAGNARTHSTKQIRQIAASIEQFGFVSPVLIDKADIIIAGHGRVEAAKLLKLKAVPTIRVEHLTDAQRRAYVIADNRLAELAGWDRDILKIELQNLDDDDLGFDLELIGFEGAELDELLDEPSEPKVDPKADAIPKVQSVAVSRPGDLWLMGDHRLLCGDARNADDYARLMGGELARMIFTDPPYNVRIDGFAGGKGKADRREFVMASGEMTESEFTTFLTEVCRQLAAHSIDGSIHFHCMDWRHIDELRKAGAAAYDDLKNLIVWTKNNGGMGTFYRSQHELIFAFKKGKAAHVNTFGLGETGRYRTNVWAYPGVNTFGKKRDAELAMHPTVKPVALVADAIKDVSHRGDIVLDSFGGSGTTLIAAEKTRRRARLLELDPLYCDVICRRYETFAKTPAILAATAQAFTEVAAERAEAQVEKEAADA